jgi:VCBS repeat-containing protein
LGLTVCVAQDVVSIVHGTVKKVDKSTKTLVVKAADGTERTIKVADQATVHGTKELFC